MWGSAAGSYLLEVVVSDAATHSALAAWAARHLGATPTTAPTGTRAVFRLPSSAVAAETCAGGCGAAGFTLREADHTETVGSGSGSGSGRGIRSSENGVPTNNREGAGRLAESITAGHLGHAETVAETVGEDAVGLPGPPPLKLSEVFRRVEGARAAGLCSIQSFSLSQPTLAQVFLNVVGTDLASSDD